MKPRAADVIIAVLVGLAAALFVVYQARAEVPAARNAAECDVVAEMALTARTLDKYGIGGEQAQKMMDDFYAMVLSGPDAERASAYIGAVLKLSRRHDMRALEPVLLAEYVAMTCARSSGNLTPIFGTDS